MFGIVLSAINAALTFVLRSVLVKFAVFFGLYFVTTEFLAYLSAHLPDASSINATLAQITPGVWYFLDYFGFTYGFPMVLSAWVLRFLIRRIPVIG
ncbi:DUF2523 domain-containing protein [Herbaspirillum sp. HC18]|nr:DUF2523 domain-containing protein [Herbaspirillum sp. HC18]